MSAQADLPCAAAALSRSCFAYPGGPMLLDEFSLSLDQGSTLAILGPSGCGKSTLLRLLAGLEAPVSGKVEIFGKTASSQGRVLAPPEERSVAFCFQYPALLPHLNALDNAALGPGEPSSRLARARLLFDELGIASLAGRRIWELSGGEAQRCALARALCRPARLLLLDEPFSSLDRLSRRLAARAVADGAARCAAQGGACAFVTHDPQDAFELAGRCAVLSHDGKLLADGSPADIAAGRFGSECARLLQNV